MDKPILDMCCGSRMFWVNKNDPRVVFADIRSESHELCDGRALHISPDIIADFRDLPFPDNSFHQVVFDPPHLVRVGEKSWMGKKYGHWIERHGVKISARVSERHSGYCGHTARLFLSGMKRRYRPARYWPSLTRSQPLGNASGKVTKPTGFSF